MGARNAGNPHVACDVEGAGDEVWVGTPRATTARQSSTLLMSGGWETGRWPKRGMEKYRSRMLEVTVTNHPLSGNGKSPLTAK
jgi:hypothetical protein